MIWGDKKLNTLKYVNMNFEIKILGFNAVNNASPLEFYKINALRLFIKNRYRFLPNITYDLNFNRKNTTFLIFGHIPQSVYLEIQKVEDKIFYFDAGFNTFGWILNEFKFLGFCDFVNYSSDFPMFYGRKEVLAKMVNVKLGLMNISSTDFYISTNSTQEKSLVEFIFDYIDLCNSSSFL